MRHAAPVATLDFTNVCSVQAGFVRKDILGPTPFTPEGAHAISQPPMQFLHDAQCLGHAAFGHTGYNQQIGDADEEVPVLRRGYSGRGNLL